jgi:flavodoxin
MSRILVAYYSRTGNTKKVAQEISRLLKADIDEIKDKKSRLGIINWLKAGRDAMKENITEIDFSKNPEKYDLVVIGTPVWGWKMVPAVRTYLINNKVKKIAFFSTSGGTNVARTFSQMQEISSKPVSTLSILEKEVKSNSFQDKVKDFCKAL